MINFDKYLAVAFAVIVVIVVSGVVSWTNFKRWEDSVEDMFDALNAFHENLELLEAGLEWDRENGAAERHIKARVERIGKLKMELKILNVETDRLSSLSIFDKMSFSKNRALVIRALATHWELKRRESIVGIVELLRQSRRK